MNSVVEIKESNEHKFQILKETIREKEMQEKNKLKKKEKEMNSLKNTLEENQLTIIQYEEYINDLKEQLNQQENEL
jgi:hypothetical protein